MKRCFKCATMLPLSEFYPHPRMGDGHLNKCKRCTRRDVQENRAARREQYRAYDRRRFTEMDGRREAIAEYGRRDEQKRRARIALSNAVKRGKITRQPCEVCGGVPADGHHDDYSRPLDVR